MLAVEVVVALVDVPAALPAVLLVVVPVVPLAVLLVVVPVVPLAVLFAELLVAPLALVVLFAAVLGVLLVTVVELSAVAADEPVVEELLAVETFAEAPVGSQDVAEETTCWP